MATYSLPSLFLIPNISQFELQQSPNKSPPSLLQPNGIPPIEPQGANTGAVPEALQGWPGFAPT